MPENYMDQVERDMGLRDMSESDLTSEQMKMVQDALEIVGLGDMAEYRAGFMAGYKAGEKEALRKALLIFANVQKA